MVTFLYARLFYFQMAATAKIRLGFFSHENSKVWSKVDDLRREDSTQVIID